MPICNLGVKCKDVHVIRLISPTDSRTEKFCILLLARLYVAMWLAAYRVGLECVSMQQYKLLCSSKPNC